MIKQIRFIHYSEEEGNYYECYVKPEQYELLMEFARDWSDLYKFLERMGRWKCIGLTWSENV